MNFYPGSCFVIKKGSGPVVVGSGMTLNLDVSDNFSHVDCSCKDNTINIQSGSVSSLNDPKSGSYGDSKEGVWISPFNGQAPLLPGLDTKKTYQVHKDKRLTLYIIYGT